MLNNPKIKTSSSIKTYQKFFNTNNFSTSKEKLFINIPKNISNNSKEAQAKSPNLKGSYRKDSIGKNFVNIGNRLININYSQKQLVSTKENRQPGFKTNDLNKIRYTHNIDIDKFNKIKLETEDDKNHDFINDNLCLNIPYENNFDLKESIKRHNSITNKISNRASFRGVSDNKSKKVEEDNQSNVKQNVIYLLEQKDKEIERLQKELVQMRNNMVIKPETLTNDSRINENIFNTNPRSLSTSNKHNQNTNFKFDVKSLDSNKIVEVFSDRSSNPKNSFKAVNSNNNNFSKNNHFNLTNRNNVSLKNFVEIFNSTKKNSYTINNLSKSSNFNPIKNIDVRSKPKINLNQKIHSSTLSNFFRKSSAKINENLTGHLKDKYANAKSSRDIIKSANLDNNSNSNTNSFNRNLSINAQINTNRDYESNSLNDNKNINSKRGPKFNSEKPYPKNLNHFENSNESNEITSNFSDFINLDKHIKLNTNNRTIENYYNNEKIRNKRCSQLEIRDVDYDENDFKNQNKLKENNKQTMMKGKSLSCLTGNSHAEIKSKLFKRSKTLFNEECFIRSLNHLEANNDSNIFEKLSELKLRTKYVLSLYAENLFNKDNVN